MGEDRCRVGKGNGSQILAGLRNTILNLFRLNEVKNVAAEIRKTMYYSGNYKYYLGLH